LSQTTVVSTKTISDATTATCNPYQTPAITNGGFDSSNTAIDPWTTLAVAPPYYPGTYSVDASTDGGSAPNIFHAHLQYVDVFGDAWSLIVLDQILTVCEGGTYSLTFNYKYGQAGDVGAYLGINIDGVDIVVYGPDGPTDWTASTPITFTASGSTAELKVSLIHGNGGYTGDVDLYIDSFKVGPV
jgi:hypothetical protein